MGTWTTQIKVGLVVVIGLILLCVLLFKASDSPLAASGDHLSVRFSSVNDLRRGAGVYLSGVQIGKVTGIELKAAENKVEIRMRVKDAFQQLRQECKAQIGVIGFVGEAYIDFVNGPVGNPPLRLTDLPLTGEDPVGIEDFLQQSEQAISQVTQLTISVNELIQSNQETIQNGITDVRGLVAHTSQALERVSKKTEVSITTVNRLILENDRRFQGTLENLNQLLGQLQKDSLVISNRADALIRSVLNLVNQNSPLVALTISDLQAGASDFLQMSHQLRRDLDVLNAEISGLIAHSRNAIETETPKIDRILDNLAGSTARLEELQNNLNQFLYDVRHGEGTIPQLLGRPDAINEVREVLQTANETMEEIRSLSGKMSGKFGSLTGPDLAWDYELRYLSLEESLHNELALLLLSPKHRYRLGFSVRDEDPKFEFQYGHDFFNGYLRGRFGFMRSKAGMGLDVWLLSRRLGITAEGVRITSKAPELNVELTWKIFPYGHIIIGAENLTDDIRYTAGMRMAGRNW